MEAITQFLSALVERTGAIGIFLATMIESFFAPIPSEIILLSAGFAASKNQDVQLLAALVVAATAGSFVGTLPFYAVARYGADTLLPKIIKKYGFILLISHEDIVKSEGFFRKYGSAVVFFARLVPAMRSIVSIPAGLFKMNFAKYTVYTLAGSFLWNLFLAGCGYLFYEQKDTIFAILKPVENIVLLLLAILIIFYLLLVARQIIQMRKQSSA